MPIPTRDGLRDPFHGMEINADLIASSFVYSAGYGRYLRPHFFLGDLLRKERHDGVEVLVSGREYARDMAAPAAMLQGETIFVRQESIRREVWSLIEEWQWYQQEGPLDRALRGFGDHLPADDLLERVTEAETETVILHEKNGGTYTRRVAVDVQRSSRGPRGTSSPMPFPPSRPWWRRGTPLPCTSISPTYAACAGSCFRNCSRPTTGGARTAISPRYAIPWSGG